MQNRLTKRLWHTNRKCFIEQFSILQTINSDGNYEHTYFEYNSKTQQLERLSTRHIEEVYSIGLKDKNKKLIYEGDIVTDGSTVLEVVFEYAEYHFKYVSGAYQYPALYSNASRFEIIGNIYENPELLELENG